MKLRWGILGYGRIAKVFEESFLDSDNSKLFAIASNSKIIKPKLKNNTVQIYPSYEKLLEDKNIDVVYIANVNNLHKDTIIKATNHKKNILVEKPAFLNINDFNECIGLVKKNNIFLWRLLCICIILKLIKLLKLYLMVK